jgi:hypothetical protein
MQPYSGPTYLISLLCIYALVLLNDWCCSIHSYHIGLCLLLVNSSPIWICSLLGIAVLKQIATCRFSGPSTFTIYYMGITLSWHFPTVTMHSNDKLFLLIFLAATGFCHRCKMFGQMHSFSISSPWSWAACICISFLGVISVLYQS